MAELMHGALEGITTPLKGIRRAAARQMVTAWEAPVFHLTVEVDMTSAMRVKRVSSGSTVTDAILLAVGRALVENPGVNAHFADGAVTTFPEANIGLAVATNAGLMVPVIHGVSQLELGGIAERRRDIVERARSAKLGMADVSGGTFTVSNLGMLNIDGFDAILNVPQVAILAVASTTERYVIRDGEPAKRPIANFTLTCDHRAVDGAMGAGFLSRLRELMELSLTGG